MNAPQPWEPGVGRTTRFNLGRVRSWVWQTLYILYSLEAGIFLVFLPWLNIWENNYLLYRYPNFHGVIANSFVRGAVLGLGIVNLLIAIQEITRLRKHPKDYPSG